MCDRERASERVQWVSTSLRYLESLHFLVEILNVLDNAGHLLAIGRHLLELIRRNILSILLPHLLAPHHSSDISSLTAVLKLSPLLLNRLKHLSLVVATGIIHGVLMRVVWGEGGRRILTSTPPDFAVLGLPPVPGDQENQL